ncbi:MAG: hypothetical protein R3Y35_03820 [Clostridia bacterium]
MKNLYILFFAVVLTMTMSACSFVESFDISSADQTEDIVTGTLEQDETEDLAEETEIPDETVQEADEETVDDEEIDQEVEQDVEEEDVLDDVVTSVLVHECDENCTHDDLDTLISNSGLTIDAVDEFILVYQNNAIDSEYLIALNEAESINTMVDVATVANEEWENAITNILILLKLEMDEVEWSDLNVAQIAWENDIQIVADEILSSSESEGSNARVYYAQELMYYYRDRAIELAVMYYDMTGVVEMPNSEIEAVG